MIGALRRIAGLVAMLLALLAPAQAQDAELVTIDTPRGVKQAFLLMDAEEPVAAVILFAGGHGGLGLQSPTSMQWGAQSFLVRARDKFAAHKLVVAVMDAPSDRRDGMDVAFRVGNAHAGDVSAVAAYLKQLADVPVWLVGTSMGTFSAAAGAIAADDIDGLVLTSPITRPKANSKSAETHTDGVASLALADITMPTLIVSHAEDACALAPAADAEKLRQRLEKAKTVEVVLLKGGDAASSPPCGLRSAHGFAGVEAEAVDAIAKFIQANNPAPAPDK
jgi:pimeloyl-ACP methyl ester carboxylesterase